MVVSLELAYILASVFIVSLVAIIAIFMLRLGQSKLFLLVSFAAGSMLAAAFLDLLPEMVEAGAKSFVPSLLGVISFFVLERFLHWHHHHIMHDRKDRRHALAYLVLVGDGFHNFIDGTIIAASYLVSIPAGIAATIAIVLHEIPQELGDAGILIYSGMSRAKAAFWNFMSAITAFLGAFVAYFFASRIEGFTLFLVGFAAGGFIYVAASDLLPELNKEMDFGKSVTQLVFFLMGVAVIWAVLTFIGG